METCVNGLIGNVNWILDYGGHNFFFFFGLMIFSGWP